MIKTLFTIGYEGSSIEDFVGTLKKAEISMIVDVREYPASRKKGFSKNVLAKILENNDIGYVHLKGLGDPKEGRDAARGGDFEGFLEIFKKHLKSDEAKEDLKNAIEIVRQTPSCLLCYERKPEECHRTIVAQKIIAKTCQNVRPLGVKQGIAEEFEFSTILSPAYA